MKSKRNITPPSGSTSAATSLVLIHEDPQPGLVDRLHPLVDSGSGHAAGAPSYSQLPLPDVVLNLPELLVLTLQLLLVDAVTLYLRLYALVVKEMDRTVNFRAEVMVILEELELTRSVSAEGTG